jgi:hypothetical protein
MGELGGRGLRRRRTDATVDRAQREVSERQDDRGEEQAQDEATTNRSRSTLGHRTTGGGP